MVITYHGGVSFSHRAMSLVSHAVGSRFNHFVGGAMNPFDDWQHPAMMDTDCPPADHAHRRLAAESRNNLTKDG